MKLLDLTLPTFAENLALDESLLEEVERDEHADEVLRIWEPTQTAVVVGRSSRIAEEVNVSVCERESVAILRRCSGGTSVVLGPGCLAYAVILRYDRHPDVPLRMIDELHRFVLGTIASGLQTAGWNVEHVGISDLAIAGRKVSGNSLRCKRNASLYHGTLLYDFPLDLLAACLATAPRQPEYRAGRSHRDFVTNLPATRSQLIDALTTSWSIDGTCSQWPQAHVAELVQERYGQEAWHRRL